MGRLLIQFAGTNTTKALSETLPKNTIIVDEDLHQLRLHDGTTAGGHIIGGSSGGGVPVGTIIPFAGNSIPEGYLLCDGSAISRTDYATLFAVIGTIYGTGDGNSTFNLPMYNAGETLVRGAPGWHTNGMVPNITGSFGVYTAGNFWAPVEGCFDTYQSTQNGESYAYSGRSPFYTFDASRSSAVYNNTTTYVRPAGIGTNFCIKYI